MNHTTQEIMTILSKVGRPFIVGSSAIFSVFGIDKKTKDVDILIETDVSIDKILEELNLLGGVYISKNSIGGIKLEYKGDYYDIWRAKDTDIYEEPYNNRKYTTAEDVISNFGYNLYQIGINHLGETYCTRHFINYAIHKELRLVNDHIKNYKKLTTKAIDNDIIIRRYISQGKLNTEM